MEYMCIGACSKKVSNINDIPVVCNCGLIGKNSYYPYKYIMNHAKYYADKNNTSISDGYIKCIKELRKKYFDNIIY